MIDNKSPGNVVALHGRRSAVGGKTYHKESLARNDAIRLEAALTAYGFARCERESGWWRALCPHCGWNLVISTSREPYSCGGGRVPDGMVSVGALTGQCKPPCPTIPTVAHWLRAQGFASYVRGGRAA